MATKQAFLNALSERIEALEKQARTLTTVGTNEEKALRKLEEDRIKKREKIVSSLLPDLTEQTIDTLSRRVPDFVTTQKIQRMIKAEAEQLLAEKTSAHTSASRNLRSFENVPGFTDLVEIGYGKPEYPRKWWQLSFYRDWRRADEIVETLGLGNWNRVLEAYTRAELETAKAKEDHETTIQAHISKERQFSKKIEATVLEELQTQLRAKLDSSAGRYNITSEIDALNRKISKRAEGLEKIQANAKKVSAEMEKLKQLRGSLRRSRQNTVPDKCLRLVSQRSDGRINSTDVTVINNYYEDDDWLMPILFYNMMTSTFNDVDVPQGTPDFHGGGGKSGGAGATSSFTTDGDNVRESTHGSVS